MKRTVDNAFVWLSAAAALLLGACAGEVQRENALPKAAISSDPPSATAQAPVEVTFDGGRSSDPDGRITAYAWYLDERLVSREASFAVTFEDPGSHRVRLVVEDDRRGRAGASSSYVVLEAPVTGSARFLAGDLTLDAGLQAAATVGVESSHPWTLGSSAPWLVPEPAAGAPGVTEVTLTVDPDSAAPGATATLTLKGALGAEDAMRVTVLLPSLVGPDPDTLSLQATVGEHATAGFQVVNAGEGTLRLELEAPEPWLTVAPLSATIGPGLGAGFAVSAACDSPGQRTATIAVGSNVPREPPRTVTVGVECDPSPEPGFDITIRYYGDPVPTPAQRAVFEAAAARWAEVVVGDLPDVSFGAPPEGTCRSGAPSLAGEVVDDLLIWVKVEEIDGPGNILGFAGPCLLRGEPGAPRLPVVGVMVLDSADLAAMESRGILMDVILHEMGHVLGIGTLWQNQAVGHMHLDDICQPGQTQRRFTGPAANAKHVEAGGEQDLLLVENQGSSGTACAHWAEDRYADELMTGWISSAGNPLSAITVASLKDLGYEVSYAQADAYAVPGPGELRAQDARFQLGEVLLTPPGPLD